MIEIKNVNHIFKTKQSRFEVLKNINLRFEEGETVGIVGYSGAGKSTLIRVINNLITPTTGEVLIDGENIITASEENKLRLRKEIGMVFQQFNILSSLTVYENIKIAIDPQKHEKHLVHEHIIEIIKLVGLEGKEKHYPKMLSGGQLQRVGIARAIVNYPKYLLCDEITSALDLKTGLEIINLLKSIQDKTNVTIIFIAHQMEMIRNICDRVVVMEDGQIIEDQDTISLFINPQTNVSKTLVEEVKNHEYLKMTNLYELIYLNELSNETILSNAIKKYLIDTNIMHAKTITFKDKTLGFLIIEITGDYKQEAIKYLKDHGIEVRAYV